MSKRWNEVISGNGWLWKQIASQHGFIFLPSRLSLRECCTDCTTKPSSPTDCLQDSTSKNYPHICDIFEGCNPSPSYKEMFLKHKRVFDRFSGGQSVTSIISGYSNRVTAIDYHNGYIATGYQHTVCSFC